MYDVCMGQPIHEVDVSESETRADIFAALHELSQAIPEMRTGQRHTYCT